VLCDVLISAQCAASAAQIEPATDVQISFVLGKFNAEPNQYRFQL
jgi:hypothetical protein